MKQATSHIFMVKPKYFGFNQQTANSNAFQCDIDKSDEIIALKAMEEFDNAVDKLTTNHINVTVIEDTETPRKPDAVFPNNWGTFHENGLVILYPMAAPNRRVEKRPDILDLLRKQYVIKTIIDLSHYENNHQYLEGTGSIIFDHIHKYAYACTSERTDINILKEVCAHINYKPIPFTATDHNNKEIYHTNVMMALTEHLAIICLESIKDEQEQVNIINSLIDSDHTIIDISLDQVSHFAGNMLGLKNNEGKNLLIMSQTALNSLSDTQIEQITKYTEILPLDVKTIETIGGGSTRCMISELFLPLK